MKTKDGVIAAGETHGRVFFVNVNAKTGKVSEPTSPEGKAKHPVVAANSNGEVLLAWTEGTGWAKGGAVAWQLYDSAGNPTSEKRRADGVPVWSLVSAFTNPDGTFVIMY
jgi:secreted PhoX family phosphatase